VPSRRSGRDHADLARGLAEAVTEHEAPVGSGTVARTKRIPVERRAEAAVIAWLRHSSPAQTTNLPRREVYRPQPAQASTAAAPRNGHTEPETTPFTRLATTSTARTGSRYGTSIP
jgi:hypothetical protein